jgi:hypothetical protein
LSGVTGVSDDQLGSTFEGLMLLIELRIDVGASILISGDADDVFPG